MHRGGLKTRAPTTSISAASILRSAPGKGREHQFPRTSSLGRGLNRSKPACRRLGAGFREVASLVIIHLLSGFRVLSGSREPIRRAHRFRAAGGAGSATWNNRVIPIREFRPAFHSLEVLCSLVFLSLITPQNFSVSFLREFLP